MTEPVRRSLVAWGVAAAALVLGACDAGTPDATGASASEARQLNDAAAMLDLDSVSSNAVATADNAEDADR